MDDIENFKYYNFQDILKILNIDHEFDINKKFPFNKGKENVHFHNDKIIIPDYGIYEMVKNKISDIKDYPISKINMIYDIPYYCNDNGNIKVGTITKDISLAFYDKKFKYGNINNKSIFEVCLYITQNAIKTNNFFIIPSDIVPIFMSFYIFNNQYGVGITNII